MLKLEAIGVKELQAALTKLGTGLPVALAAGLNRTIAAVEQAELNGMERDIDKPTPFSLNALKTWRAHPRHLDAGIYIQPIQAEYLKYAIDGGIVPRTVTPVIGRARINEAGNIPNKRRRGKWGAKGKKSSGSRGFFAGTPGNSKRILAYGLWERIGRDRVKLIAKPEKNVPRHRRWQYHRIAEQVADRRLMADVSKAIDAAIKRGDG